MGGEGHILHAIKSLKANRALLKKRIDRKKNGYSTIYGDAKATFKETTAADMIAIRKKIKRYKAQEKQQFYWALGITIGLLYFISWLLFST